MTNTKGILLTMLSAITFGFAFTLGPMTYGEGGSNPITLTFLRNFLSLPILLLILWQQKISLRVTAKELASLAILGGIGNAVTTWMLFIAFSLIDVGIATTIHFIYWLRAILQRKAGTAKDYSFINSHFRHRLFLLWCRYECRPQWQYVFRTYPRCSFRYDLCFLYYLHG